MYVPMTKWVATRLPHQGIHTYRLIVIGKKKHTYIRVLCVLNTRKYLRRNTQPLIK